MRKAIFAVTVVLVAAAAVFAVLVAGYREKDRREAWWRETRPSCRLLTVVSRTFRPPQAIYECPGGVLVTRTIGD